MSQPSSENVRNVQRIGIWGASVLFHVLIFIPLAWIGWTVGGEGFKEFEVGIMVKEQRDDAVVFKGEETEIVDETEMDEANAEEVPTEPLTEATPHAQDPFDELNVIGPAQMPLAGAAPEVALPAAVGNQQGLARTEFFGAVGYGSKFIYALDCSGSMEAQDALEWAKRELTRSLQQLPPAAEFHIIFFNHDAEAIKLGSGRRLVQASEENKKLATQRIRQIQPGGGTECTKAVKLAIGMGADVVFLLTDAVSLFEREADEITRANRRRRVKVHTIQFSDSSRDSGSAPVLKRIALLNGGTYRHVNIHLLRDMEIPR